MILVSIDNKTIGVHESDCEQEVLSWLQCQVDLKLSGEPVFNEDEELYYFGDTAVDLLIIEGGWRLDQ